MAKKKKVRVAFNKNRQKRTRANDMTRGYGEGDSSATEQAPSERVRAKGELSRHRTVMHEVTRGADGVDQAPRLAVDLSTCLPGRVVRVHGLVSVVQAEDGHEVRCNVRRILKTMSIDGRNVVAVRRPRLVSGRSAMKG